MSYRERRPGDAIPGDLVREYRKRHGLTQDELGRRLGVAGKAVVSGWETGRTTCEGPAAEFLLHLLGRGNAAIEIPALSRKIDDHWNRAGDAITAWRQVASIPQEPLSIDPAKFASLFPAAALPSTEVPHGFPFTNEGLKANVSGVSSNAWLGSIPYENDRQPAYLWIFTRDGKFGYREKLWEDQPSAVTRGHFDVDTLTLVSLQTVFFLARLAGQLGLKDALGFSLQLNLRGSRGRGVASATCDLSDRTNCWAEDIAEAAIQTDVQEMRSRGVDVGIRLAAELAMQVNIDAADPKVLREMLKVRRKSSRELGFLNDIKL